MGLKVGIVTEYYYPLLGGISENVHHTATELMARGHAVTIVSAAPRTNGFHLPQPNGIPTRRIGRSFTVYGNGAIAHFTVGTHLWRDMRDLLHAEQFDILQLHSPLFFTLPPLAALLGNCARVGTFHSYFEPTLVYAALKGVMQRQFVNRLDGVTVVSPSVLRALSRYFDLDARVIPNGVDTQMFNPAVPRLARFAPTSGRSCSSAGSTRATDSLSCCARLPKSAAASATCAWSSSAPGRWSRCTRAWSPTSSAMTCISRVRRC